MQWKHHKFRRGHKVRNSDVFLLLIFTPLTTIQTLTIFLLRNNDSHPWAWGTCYFSTSLYPNTVNIRFKVSPLVSRLMQGNPNSRIQEIFTVVTKVFLLHMNAPVEYICNVENVASSGLKNIIFRVFFYNVADLESRFMQNWSKNRLVP